MSKGCLSEQSRLLVDALFHERDQHLWEAFRERQVKKDRKMQFAAVLGMNDEALLGHLVELEVQPEAIAAIAIVPLAVVAWADHAVQPQEREAILQAARASGVQPQDGGIRCLNTGWPSVPALSCWTPGNTIFGALCRQLNSQEIAGLKHDLLDRARDVAEAAGGILGLGNKVSANERAALRDLDRRSSDH